MELLLLLLVALVPPFAIVFLPRKALAATVVVVAALLALAGFWSWQLNDRCVSDGCIGAVIVTGFTLLTIAASLVAGGIRWAMIDGKKRRDGGWKE